MNSWEPDNIPVLVASVIISPVSQMRKLSNGVIQWHGSSVKERRLELRGPGCRTLAYPPFTPSARGLGMGLGVGLSILGIPPCPQRSHGPLLHPAAFHLCDSNTSTPSPDQPSISSHLEQPHPPCPHLSIPSCS